MVEVFKEYKSTQEDLEMVRAISKVVGNIE